MKVRHGFVSNSSSSSFVVLGVGVRMSREEVNSLGNLKTLNVIALESEEFQSAEDLLLGEEIDDGSTAEDIAETFDRVIKGLKDLGIKEEARLHVETWEEYC